MSNDQQVNRGTTPGDGTGETLYSAFGKYNLHEHPAVDGGTIDLTAVDLTESAFYDDLTLSGDVQIALEGTGYLGGNAAYVVLIDDGTYAVSVDGSTCFWSDGDTGSKAINGDQLLAVIYDPISATAKVTLAGQASGQGVFLPLDGGVMAGDIDIDGHQIIVDADGDSFFGESSDDIVDLYLRGIRTIRFQNDGTTTRLEIRDIDSGAGINPQLALYRASGSPAASDLIASLRFDGNDSGGNQTTYVRLLASILDPTDTSEDGALAIQAVVAGTLTSLLSIAAAGVDFLGKQIANHIGKTVTGVSGTLTTTAHSGNLVVTSGNITVPTTEGFCCLVKAGGAHTITFNGTVTAAATTGQVCSVAVQSSTVVIISPWFTPQTLT